MAKFSPAGIHTMTELDLSLFDENAAGNPDNTIFGLPFNLESAKLVLLPVPWEVTVSYGSGTARIAEHIFKASLQVDVFDADFPDAWKQGFYLLPVDKDLLLKSDYLRKEAELFMDYISHGDNPDNNKFMCKSLKDINEGGDYLNRWVYEKTIALLKKGKLVGLLGGDHSTPLGYWKALAETHGSFGILQIDAHCDLRVAYQGMKYSHASITYNALEEIPELEKIVQVGVRDYSQHEWDFVCNSNYRVVLYRDQQLKDHLYNGGSWHQICMDIIDHLPQKVHISFDIDGLDPKLCPNTGTPVPGGFEMQQIHYLLKQILVSGRTIIGFDLVEIAVGVDNHEWDSNVGARQLWHLCNLLVASNSAS